MASGRKALGQVRGQAADAAVQRKHPGPGNHLAQVHDLFPLPKGVEQRGHGAQVVAVGPQPEEMGGDPGQLRQQHPDVLGPFGDFHPQELFHRQAEAEVVDLAGQVVQTVHQGHALVVGAVFAHLFDAPVEEADIGIGLEDELAVQLHQDPQHPVGAGVRGPHVEQHGFGACHGLSLIHIAFPL